MIESITTLTPAQQVAAVQSKESEVNRLQIHEIKQNATDQKESEQKKKSRLNAFEQALQKTLASSNQSVHISLDDLTKKVVVKIIDNSTNEVVRQLPTEEMLRISRNLAETDLTRGNLTDARI